MNESKLIGEKLGKIFTQFYIIITRFFVLTKYSRLIHKNSLK